MDKPDFYRQVKVIGMMVAVPFILAAGPFVGYAAGQYLVARFAWPGYLLQGCVLLGFCASVFEAVRIIRVVIKAGQ